MSYFKYTNGEAFTLDNADYKGFFNISDGSAYTGKVLSSESELLTKKNTFISEVFLNEYEFDDIYDNVTTLNEYYTNSFDILNKTELEKIFNILNNNNLKIFKRLISINPNLFNFSNNDFHYYGLSSTEIDQRDDDRPSGKQTYSHIDPFSFSSEWAFLDKTEFSTFTVDSNDNFSYNILTNEGNFELSGSFVNSNPISITNNPNLISDYLKIDNIDNKMFIINDDIKIYDSRDYNTCNTLNLVDVIELEGGVIPGNIRIGRNYRLEPFNSGFYLKRKYDNTIIYTFNYSDMDILDPILLEIRDVDDLISILHKKDDSLQISFLYPNYSSDEIETFEMSSFDYENQTIKLYFSDFDSNIFYISNGTQFQLRLISYPYESAGSMNPDDMLYLRDYLYDTTYERYNIIPIKWNSNNLKSNFFNNISFDMKSFDGNIYSIIHNIGRIYALKQTIDDVYNSGIPLNTEKSFDNVKCSESSLGIYLNFTLSQIITDILTLHTKASHITKIDSNGIIPQIINKIDLETKNLYLHGNETINAISLQRIFNNLIEIQNELISVT